MKIKSVVRVILIEMSLEEAESIASVQHGHLDMGPEDCVRCRLAKELEKIKSVG